MSSKVLFYHSVEEFKKELYRLRLPMALVEEDVGHETAHLNKARELGYRADYCIVFSDVVKLKFRPAIHVYEGQNLTDSDLQKIISVVGDPSDRDTEKLKSLGFL